MGINEILKMERALNSRLSTSRWLEAVWEPSARISALPGGLEMLDLVGDGEARLIAVDLPTDNTTSAKIRLFKGGEQMNEVPMLQPPCGIVGFYTENDDPRSAVVAVGSGANVFIYKNMKPHFKYSLPYLDAHPKEREIWQKAGIDGELDIQKLYCDLELLSKELGASFMTSRTLKFLSMDENLRFEFADQYRSVPLFKMNNICTIGLIRRDSWDDPSCSCLIVGTESGEILILDPRSFSLIDKYHIGWAPVAVASVGLWSGDGRVYVVSRDIKLGVVKKGNSSINLWEELPAPAVAIATLTTEGLAVITMNGALIGFSSKGARLWEVHLPGLPLDMISIPVPQSGLSLLAISVPQAGGILIYDSQHHVDTIPCIEPISAMKFGRMGQEERALALVSVRGALCVKILKRTANFSNRPDNFNNTNTSVEKVTIPKKTRLFVEQTVRERNDAKKIHGTFEKDFLQLQLAAAEKSFETFCSKENVVSNKVTMSISVLGLGPTYVIRTILTSIAENDLNEGLFLVFRSKQTKIEPRYFRLPLLPPGISFPVRVKATPDSLIAERIQVLLCKEDHITPISTATVLLPIAEPDIEV